MNVRAAAIAATAAFALAGLGAGPAFADNHISVAPQGQDLAVEQLNPQGQYLRGEQGPQYHLGQDGAFEH
ncbi:hypothetical protein ACIQV3_23325 [Streptomyces sp. NPDC099050]|uniref:hypothetical protein n=1 Tax=Streptomyces sp. NPDC099050 TaxID=3366100 RepID=UPI0038065BEC